MKKFLLVVAISSMAASLALADSACPTGTTLASYVSAAYGGTASPTFTCFIGGLDFSNFTFSSAGTNAETASSVSVNTVTTIGNVGFTFDPAITNATSTGPAQTEDDALGFTVTAISGGSIIDDLGIVYNGSFTGTGATQFSETETGANFVLPGPGGDGSCGPPGTCVFAVTNPPTNLGPIEEVFTAPVSSISIVKDFGANTGTDGSVSISEVQNTFSYVPEPRLGGVLMLGLLAAFGVSKKFRSVVSQ
jgi:hypothetical protein